MNLSRSSLKPSLITIITPSLSRILDRITFHFLNVFFLFTEYAHSIYQIWVNDANFEQ